MESFGTEHVLLWFVTIPNAIALVKGEGGDSKYLKVASLLIFRVLGTLLATFSLLYHICLWRLLSKY